MYLQFCPTQPRGFTRSTRTRVRASECSVSSSDSKHSSQQPPRHTEALRASCSLSTLRGGGGGCITSQKSICIDGQRPTQASTSPYSVERLLRERLSLLEICLTHHVSTEEWLKRADMKPFSKEGKQHRWKMIGHNIL